MAFTQIAAAGEYMDSLFVGMRHFPTKKVILLSTPENLGIAEKARKDLLKFKIPVFIKKLEGDLWEAVFQAVKEIKEVEGESDIIINSASGDSGLSRCAICSAAFVNGLKAFTVVKDEVILMPILKFSYYKILTDKKMEILKYLFSNQDCCSSLDELGRKLKMSLPLVSYHINGNLKSEGLKEMGLIVAEEFKGKVRITLTLLGRLIVKGYVR
ncbi:MAG TPA: hypothetical protein VFF28_07390 [Candidatus Nanoarchaeia archaeon]|nr:hypothetical protein [Candidatus Nanoarchaeia archaeon]